MEESSTPASLTRTCRASLALLVVAASLLFFSVPIADNDLWGHVLFGRRILSEGLPTTNDYSFTEPTWPWINHEILAECVFAGIYDALGSAGLLGLKWLCGLSTLAVLARMARTRGADWLATAGVLVFAASLMSWGYHARPQIFSFLFLSITWLVIDRAAPGDKSECLWALPPLFAVWINTHGGVLAGFGILGVSAIFFAQRTPAKRIVLAGAVTASLVALLLNPYGWRLLVFLLEDLPIDRPISEWRAIPLFDLSNLQFKVAFLLALAGYAFGGCRDRRWEIVVVATAAVATFRHERHLPLFAIVAAPGLAVALTRLLAKLRFSEAMLAQDRTARAFLTVASIAVAVAMALPPLRLHRELGLEIAVPARGFPVDAVSFVRRQGLSGNLVVPFGWGEYAIWHLHPDLRVNIDGRYTTAYSHTAIDAAWRYLDGGAGWDRHLDDADVAITDTRHVTAQRLAGRSDWRRIYSDETASVFVREGAPPRFSTRQPAPSAPSFLFP